MRQAWKPDKAAVEVGERIAYAREMAGLLQEELSELMTVDDRTLRRWEHAESPIMLSDAMRLAELCDCTLAFLAGEERYDEPLRACMGQLPFRRQGKPGG